MHEEEKLANDFYRELKQRYASASNIDITIEGAGVHWSCSITQNGRLCKVNCFIKREYTLKTPEYYISFKREEKNIAVGRTTERNQILKAIDSWSSGVTLGQLHQEFPFVDFDKRSLIACEQELLAHCKRLHLETQHQLHNVVGDQYELWFKKDDRACEISRYKDSLYMNFYWDDCHLCRTKPLDLSSAATALEAWLCERMNPSKIEHKFSWIDMGEVGRAYECGKGIEGEFVQSWVWIESFFSDHPQAPAIIEFIRQIRSKGYDKQLRAGQSLYFLGISRSRRHGLRMGQSALWISFGKDGMYVGKRSHSEAAYFSKEITLSSELEKLLDKLKELPVD